MLYTNEYLISSNNSINDNKYNAEKVSKSTSYKIKRMLKPLLRLLKNTKNTTNNNNHNNNKKMNSFDDSTSCSYVEDDCFWSSEIDDNSANEALEAKLFNEINNCMDSAAIYVYKEENLCEMQPVFPDQTYVPVHFARTEAGTFFWTTMQRSADSDLIEPQCHSDRQVPQLQFGDRWVQA